MLVSVLCSIVLPDSRGKTSEKGDDTTAKSVPDELCGQIWIAARLILDTQHAISVILSSASGARGYFEERFELRAEGEEFALRVVSLVVEVEPVRVAHRLRRHHEDAPKVHHLSLARLLHVLQLREAQSIQKTVRNASKV